MDTVKVNQFNRIHNLSNTIDQDQHTHTHTHFLTGDFRDIEPSTDGINYNGVPVKVSGSYKVCF